MTVNIWSKKYFNFLIFFFKRFLGLRRNSNSLGFFRIFLENFIFLGFSRIFRRRGNPEQ